MVSTKTVLSMLVASYALVTRPMEQDVKTPEQDRPLLRLTRSVTDDVISGEMFAVPVSCQIPGEKQRYELLRPKYDLVPQPTDQGGPWFKIEAASQDHTAWEIMKYPWKNFPAWLPLTAFMKADGTIKTDGDIVQLTHTKSGKVTQILLTLRQLGTYSPYQDHGKFDQYMAWLLTRQVSKNPVTLPAQKKSPQH